MLLGIEANSHPRLKQVTRERPFKQIFKKILPFFSVAISHLHSYDYKAFSLGFYVLVQVLYLSALAELCMNIKIH